jgi:cytoskeleton protein RodZ
VLLFVVNRMNKHIDEQANVTPPDELQEPLVTEITEVTEVIEPPVPVELPGARLAARRVEMRWSHEDVAAKLKLAPRQIIALETDDFASLPGMAIVRGFIRSYAKLLELDPEPLVELIAREPNPAFDPMVLRRPLPSMGFSGRRYASFTRHKNNARRMAGLGALVLIFLLVIVFAGRQMGWFALPSMNALISATSSVADISAMTGSEANNAANDSPALPSGDKLEEMVSSPALDAAHALELKLREDTWVEISNMNGTKLVSRLMKAGTTEKFEIKEPVVLVVGNATGVDARLRGQSLNLRAVARDNVSKLSLK